jgi:acyl-CoA synthetase (AMP-forming)/AMP-acid ligase II
MPGFFAELETTTRRQPGSPAFASPSGIFSYETFSRVIDNVADNASANGLAPGELVHIKSADSGLRYLLVLGFLKAGLTVSVTSRPSAFAEHGTVVDALVEEPSDSGASRINVRKRLTLSPSWLQPVKDGRTARQADLDYALVIGSSGSTGKTKLIRVSRASLEREIARNFDDPHYEGELRHLSTSGDTSLLTLKDYASVLMKAD